MQFVDRDVVGLGNVAADGGGVQQVARVTPAERQAQDRLARGPHDALETDLRCRAEDVVRAEGVDLERLPDGAHARRRDRREVDDRVGAAEGLDRLAHGGQVGSQVSPHRITRHHHVHVEHVIAVIHQIANDRASGLAAAAGYHHSRHRRLQRSVPVAREAERRIRRMLIPWLHHRQFLSVADRATGRTPATAQLVRSSSSIDWRAASNGMTVGPLAK